MIDDLTIIDSAFNRIKELELIYGDAIPIVAIRPGFDLHGETVLLENQAKGIFKPRQMRHGAISIKTTIRRDGGAHIYNDLPADDGYFHYKLQKGDPKAGGNKHLWESFESKLPFIYFRAIAPAIYKALWPCFVKGIEPDKGYCVVAVGEARLKVENKSDKFAMPDEIETRYIIRETNVRLHQASFRENVLQAYKYKCAITGLPIPKLIEAAHIIPDKLIGDKQTITNGIALNRIHHRAYDTNLIGIDPNGKIHLSSSFMGFADKEVLTKYFGSYEGKLIWMPSNSKLRPNQDYLARRFEMFCRDESIVLAESI